MLTDRKESLRAAWQQATHIDKEVPTTGYAQTKMSWARRATSYDELPAIYHDRMKALLHDRPLPHAVLTPTFPGHIRRENEKLVFSLDHQIYVWERIKNDLHCTSYALEGIQAIEIGTILLYAWIGITGVTSDGALTTSILKFNSVTDWLFAPFIQEIRGEAGDVIEADREVEIKKLDNWVQPNFKFKNYARRSLMPGEKTLDALWQPEIRNQLPTILGRSFFRTIAMTHLLILTDRELIDIREDKDSPRWRDESRYGGVWKYIPLDKISSITLIPKEKNRLALVIHLPENDNLECLFVASQQPAAVRFLSQVEKVLPRTSVKHEFPR